MTVPARDLLSNPEKFDNQMGVTKMGAQKMHFSMLRAFQGKPIELEKPFGVYYFLFFVKKKLGGGVI